MAESYEPKKSEVGWVKAVRPQPINSDGLRFASPILRLYSRLMKLLAIPTKLAKNASQSLVMRGNDEFLEVS